MRLSDRCGSAPTLPTMIVIMASAASASPQVTDSAGNASANNRRKTAKAAAFVATAMNEVTGVGAPWYTSGVQVWNGATEHLNARPTEASATPVSRSGSDADTLSPIAAA